MLNQIIKELKAAKSNNQIMSILSVNGLYESVVENLDTQYDVSVERANLGAQELFTNVYDRNQNQLVDVDDTKDMVIASIAA